MLIGLLAGRAQRASAAVTLVYFHANWQADKDTVVFEWETQSELNTAGFQIKRSTASDSGYTSINGGQIVLSEGDQLTGATYSASDNDPPPTDTTYWYQLVEITRDQQANDVGSPVEVVIGGTKTNTPTPTGTPTPTPTRTSTGTPRTPTITAIPTKEPTATRGPSATPTIYVPGTPSVFLGSTVTPGVPGISASATATVASARAATATSTNVPPTATPIQNAVPTMPTSSIATPLLAVAQVTRAPTAVPPTLAPTSATVVAMEPIIIATESNPTESTTSDNSGVLSLALIAAAGALLAGGVYAILRQTGKS